MAGLRCECICIFVWYFCGMGGVFIVLLPLVYRMGFVIVVWCFGGCFGAWFGVYRSCLFCDVDMRWGMGWEGKRWMYGL